MKKIWNWFKRFEEPLITDRSIDLAAALIWLCFAGWGIASAISGLKTISNLTAPWYETAWGASIGFLSIVAMLACVSTFFTNPNVEMRIRKKSFELWSVSALAGFVIVYPILAIIQALDGDANRISLAFAATSYLIFPVWRARHLYKRIRKLKDTQEITKGANAEGMV